MPRKKWIDKKTATHFTVLHRPQNDPLIHDASASSMILNPTVPLNAASKTKKIDDLASELGVEVENIRENEGEAANHGIYYDDTEYDYMQHLREIGSGSGDAHFVEATTTQTKGKVKQQSLEDALKNVNLDERARELLDDEILPSKNLRKVTYQAQQDVPDVLAGFQPDMDPRLREVLVALEDDAYVDDDDDIFGELAKDGQEIEEDEFDEGAWDEEAGWESDDTAKPTKEYRQAPEPTPEMVNDDREHHGDGNWLADFMKRDQQRTSMPRATPSDDQSSMMTTTTNGGSRKKRKGALTNPSSYSMSSSSMFRTEGLTTLDARFERIEEQYNEDIDDMASVSMASSTASSVTGPVRGDFDGIMDDFLGNYSMSGKKFVKKGKYQSGMEQLDEVRKGLGPAIIRRQRT